MVSQCKLGTKETDMSATICLAALGVLHSILSGTVRMKYGASNMHSSLALMF